MKHLLFSGWAVLLTAVAHLEAGPVTISFGAQQYGSAIGLADGTELPVESLVRFGYFNIPLEQVAARGGNFSLLNDSFIELASTRIGYFGGTTQLDDSGQIAQVNEAASPYEEAAGLFGHTVTYDPDLLGLQATRHYLWIMDAPTAAGATQYGLFSDADWIAPTFGEAIYDVSTVDPLATQDLYFADRGPEQSSIAGFGPLNKLRQVNATLSPVPEPSLTLLVLAATTVLGLRRRRPITTQL